MATPATYEPAGHEHLPGTAGAIDKKQIAHEYYDYYDEWSNRDLLLSLMPLIISYAFKDVDLHAALAFATALAYFLFIMRLFMWDGTRKTVWPTLDIINCILFPVMLGLSYVGYRSVVRWWPIIAPAVFASAALGSLVIRRPFTAHYARYPKAPGGHGPESWCQDWGLLRSDKSWQRTSDVATFIWWAAFATMCLLSLIPVMCSGWWMFHVLNVIFNYCVPAALIVTALIITRILGIRYRHNAERNSAIQRTEGTAGYPTGSPQQSSGGAGYGTTGTTGYGGTTGTTTNV